MNQGHKIRSVVVKQVSKWMIIVLTRVEVWRVGSTLLPTSSIEYPAANYPISSLLLPPPIHLPLGDVCLINKKNETWILVVVQFYPRLIFYLPCEQWFLQAGRYAMKGEKLLQVTVNFSIEHACPCDVTSQCQNTSSCFAGNIRDINIQQPDGNKTVNITIGLINKTTTLHLQHAFLCIPSLFLHNYDMKMHNFVFYK